MKVSKKIENQVLSALFRKGVPTIWACAMIEGLTIAQVQAAITQINEASIAKYGEVAVLPGDAN